MTSTPSGLAVRQRPAGLIPRARWTITVYAQRARSATRSWRWWFTTTLVVGFWFIYGSPIYAKSAALGVFHTALAIAFVFGRAYRYSGNNLIQVVAKDYLARKVVLYRLIREMSCRELATAESVRRFQEDALSLIASYVRGHRGDYKATDIFVNLLIAEGDEIVVLARDRDHRLPAARYPKAGMLAWEAIRTGQVMNTGDAQKETPNCAGKPYKSILVLPIRDDAQILGAVSIDSVRRHHFDIEAVELERYLAPYVGLLAWTLQRRMLTLKDANADLGGKDGGHE